LGAPPSYLGDAVTVIEPVRYRKRAASVVVSRDSDDLVFWSSYDDYGKTIVEESRIAVPNFMAKGEGSWPWYDLGDKRDGTAGRSGCSPRDTAPARSPRVIEILRAGGGRP